MPLPSINGYRDGDFISGSIALADGDNRYWGDGLHTDYWSSHHLRDAIRTVAASSGAPASS